MILETFVVADRSGYSWFVIDKHTHNVMAQGFAKHRKTAQRQADDTADEMEGVFL